MSAAEILTAAVAAIFSAGGAYAAVRVELRFLRESLDDLKNRVIYLERKKA